MHPDVRSLQPHYAEGKPRHQTYRDMVESMLVEVRRRPHRVWRLLRPPWRVCQGAARRHRAGAKRRLRRAHWSLASPRGLLVRGPGHRPGSAWAAPHYEASQFMFYSPPLDPSAYLILWQVGIAGDRTYRRFATGPEYRRPAGRTLCARTTRSTIRSPCTKPLRCRSPSRAWKPWPWRPLPETRRCTCTRPWWCRRVCTAATRRGMLARIEALERAEAEIAETRLNRSRTPTAGG
jgi:hypothetical protein